MDVRCELCGAKGEVQDQEVARRVVLHACKDCGTRYLVTPSGAKRMPKGPPPRPEPRPPTGAGAEGALLFSDREVKLLRELAAPAAAATSLTHSSVAALPTRPVQPSGSSLPSLPIGSLYPLAAPPSSGLRHPALVGGVLAGLLVGAVSLGVEWARYRLLAPEPAPVAVESHPIIAATAPAPVAALAPAPAEPARASAPSAPEAPPKPSARPVPASPKPRAESEPEPAVAPAAVAAPTQAAAPAAVAAPSPEPAAAPSKAPQAAAGLASAISAAANDPAGESPSHEAAAEPVAAPFSRDAAIGALSAAAAVAASCRSVEGPFGVARVAVTFAPSGSVTSALIEGPPFAGTPPGGCIARAFRAARVQPFSGGSVTVHKSVSIF